MTLEKIKNILDAQVLVGSDALQTEIETGCGCDLMSDVLAFSKANSILLTGITNPQVVRTAELSDIKAICFVRGKKPSEETVKLAIINNIPLLLTILPLFEACGKLYNAGLTQDIVIVHPKDHIGKLREILRVNRISGTPVVENNKLVGIISIEDFIKCLAEGEVDALVEQKMTNKVETLCADEPIIHAVN